jgi:DNA gyrase/topoisomerase IV subunit A
MRRVTTQGHRHQPGRRHHRDDVHQPVGKIIRIDTKTVRSAGRSTSGVKLLNLDTDDKVGAAVVIPPKTPTPTRKWYFVTVSYPDRIRGTKR